MDTFYIIDYENVGSSGLAGCDKLTASDHINIFFTENNTKISMSEIANHGDAELKMTEVSAGKQSADIHISSYLGYLLGEHKNKDCSIVVISKDSDFDKMILFWKEKTGISISRAEKIKAALTKTASDKKDGSSKKSKAKDSGSAKKTAEKNEEPTQKSKTTDVDGKTTLNNAVVKLLSQAGFENDVVGHVASTVIKNIDAKNSKQQIYRAIISKYGQDKGLKAYNCIKKELKAKL